ncbi:hypothetical protein PG995_010423 [Apiospora arundinis]
MQHSHIKERRWNPDHPAFSQSSHSSSALLRLKNVYRVARPHAPTTTVVSAREMTIKTHKYRETTASPGPASHENSSVENVDWLQQTDVTGKPRCSFSIQVPAAAEVQAGLQSLDDDVY